MRRHLFNDHSATTSCIHRLDARLKIAAAVLYIVIVVSTPPQHLLAYTIYGGLLLWTIALAQIPLGLIASRAALVLPFSAVAALGLLFSANALWIVAGVVMKSMLSVTALLVLVATTPMTKLMTGLRQLKVSPLFLDIVALTIRYLSVLMDESRRLRRAAAARGYRPTWLGQVRTIGHLIGNLFVRSFERSERIYGAMRMRGYTND